MKRDFEAMTREREEAWVGENVVFTIQVSNQGPDPATGVFIRDIHRAVLPDSVRQIIALIPLK